MLKRLLIGVTLIVLCTAATAMAAERCTIIELFTNAN